jgi:glycosyltransferase involved in cell wall biosynthesis
MGPRLVRERTRFAQATLMVNSFPAPTEARRSSTPADVSVVVIFKDADDFLEEALESVRAQTFPRWELLLVDDGSRDRSTEIARRYNEQAPGQIRYLEHDGHTNRGMSASRNLGIAHARGEFLSFLDADDVLVPTALEEQVTVLRSHPSAGMVYGPLEYWYSWSGAPEDETRDFVSPTGVPPETLLEPPTLLSLFLQNNGFAPSGMLTRRALVERVGGFEEAFRDLYEDQVFAAKICLATHVYVAGRCWYRYRQHPKACCLTAERDGTMRAAREPFLRWLLDYLDEGGWEGSDAWRLVREELGLVRRARNSARLVEPLSRIAPRLRGLLRTSR